MTLKTWSFAKKKNSTAQPTGTGRDYSVYMKENTSIENPVFILGTGIDADINMCQWGGKYYFIDDSELLSKDQIALHCSTDVLATHKTAIGNYTAFIKRAASLHDPYLLDSALSVQQNIVSETMATTSLFTDSQGADITDQSGCYIVRCVSPSSESPTGIASFVMSKNELNTLLDFITTESNFQDVLQDSLVKSFFNPFQYIISIMWLPINRNGISGVDRTLKLGWWNAGTFRMLTSAGYYKNIQVNIPTMYYSGDFRAKYRAFTEARAYIPALGVVDLDPEALTKNLYAEVALDYVTGSLSVAFYERSEQGGVTVNKDPFGSYKAQLGVPIQCGQLSSMGQAVGVGFSTGSLIEDIGSAVVAAGADVISGVSSIGGVISNIAGITRSSTASQNVFGSAGEMESLIAHPRMILFQRAYGCGEFANTVFGRPLCKNRQINTLSGFVLCEGASIALPAPDSEIDKVNTYLNTGFYYE